MLKTSNPKGDSSFKLSALMDLKLPTKTPKRIIIIGDAGRGKTTFARRLSSMLGIETHSTDDFYWKTKFIEKQDPKISHKAIEDIYQNSSWIVEGATANLIMGGLEKSDIIFLLEFNTIFAQWWNILKRHLGRVEERPKDLFILLRHVLYKRYGIGYERGKPTIRQLIHPYSTKVVTINSYRDIDHYLKLFEK